MKKMIKVMVGENIREVAADALPITINGKEGFLVSFLPHPFGFIPVDAEGNEQELRTLMPVKIDGRAVALRAHATTIDTKQMAIGDAYLSVRINRLDAVNPTPVIQDDMYILVSGIAADGLTPELKAKAFKPSQKDNAPDDTDIVRYKAGDPEVEAGTARVGFTKGYTAIEPAAPELMFA